MKKLYSLFPGLILLLIAVTFIASPFCHAEVFNYECSMMARKVAEDGIDFDGYPQHLPTAEQKLKGDASSGTFTIDTTNVKRTALKSVHWNLMGGMIFDVFQYPKDHPDGAHMVLRFLHPVTKQMSFQIFPVGLPSMKFSFGGSIRRVKGGTPDEALGLFEYYADCKVKGLMTDPEDSSKKTTTRLYRLQEDHRENLEKNKSRNKNEIDLFACFLSYGRVKENYTPIESASQVFNLPNYIPEKNPVNFRFTESNQDLLTELKLLSSSVNSHQLDMSYWLGWNQRTVGEFSDFFVDSHLNYVPKQVQTISYTLVTPATKDPKASWIMDTYNVHCVRTTQNNKEKKLEELKRRMDIKIASTFDPLAPKT